MVDGRERSSRSSSSHLQGHAAAAEDDGQQVSSLLSGLSLTTTQQQQQQQQQERGEEKALSALFLEGQALVEALEEGAAGEEDRRGKLERGLRLFTDLKGKVATLGLGRSGEEAEDLGTADLKFVLVDYSLGRLQQQQADTSQEGGMRARKACLEVAKRHYGRFMAQCERLRLLCGEDLRAWEAEAAHDAEAEANNGDHSGEDEDDGVGGDDDRRRRALLPTSGGRRAAGGGGAGGDAAAQRQRKIERFRRERAGKARLQELNALYAKMLRDANGDEDLMAEREEVERERILLWIGACIRRILDEWPLLRQELQILGMMQEREEMAGPQGQQGKGKAPPPPPQQAAKPLSVTHIDAVGGRLRMRKEELRAQVLRPGYNLPTMSLEELAAQEVAEAREREARAKDAPKGPRRYAQLEAEGSEDDAKLVEEAAYHDRAWDDWKDEHPRGMGNKAGKRF